MVERRELCACVRVKGRPNRCPTAQAFVLRQAVVVGEGAFSRTGSVEGGRRKMAARKEKAASHEAQCVTGSDVRR